MKHYIAQPRNNDNPRFLFNQTSPTNISMVLEARINSHNERPEGAETALWISNPSPERRGRRWFNQLADIPTIYTANSESSL